MRTVTAGETTVLQTASYDTHLKVEIEDDVGAFQSFSTLDGDVVMRCEISKHEDEPVARCTFAVWRNNESGESLVPLFTTGAWAGLFDIAREIKVSAAAVASAASVGAGDWKLLFHGVIDEYDASSNPMTGSARDKIGSVVADRWVETETEYASASMKTTMQAILDGHGGSETLYGANPGFTMLEYVQQKQGVLEALNVIARLIGYKVEPRWDNTAGAFQLQLRQPARTATTAEWTFSESDYIDITELAVSRHSIRNVISVLYTETSSGDRDEIISSSTDSIAKYGRQWMQFDEGADSSIDTSAEATTLADAARDDLKEPVANHEIKTFLFWPVQLGDYYQFNANAVHFTANQKFGVVGFRHVFENGHGYTYIKTRDTPVAFVDGWLGGGGGVDRNLPGAALFPVLDASDLLTASVDGDQYCASVRVVASKTGTPTEAAVDGETAINGQNLTTSDLGNINDVATSSALTWAAGDGIIYISWRAYTREDGGGLRSPIYNLEWDPSKSADLTYQLQPSQSGTTATLAMALQDPLSILDDVRFKSHSGSGDFDFSDPTDLSWTVDAAPYSATATIVGKHNTTIMVAIGWDDGGTTRYIIDGWTYDADSDAETGAPSIGFGDDGYPIVGVSGDEDVAHLMIAAADGSDPSAIASDASLTTADAESIGSTVVGTTTSAAGWNGKWVIISDGTNSDLVYVETVASAPDRLNLAAGTPLANAYSAGATCSRLAITPSGVVRNARSGAITLDGAAAGTATLQIDIGGRVHVTIYGINSGGVIGPANGPHKRRRGDTEFVPPEVKVQATRSGTTVTIVIEATDPSLAVTLTEYKIRSGAGTLDASWQTSWTSQTGTAGTNAALSRTKDVTSPDGLDSEFFFRVGFTDHNGTTQYKGDSIALATLQQVTKEFLVAAADVRPGDDTTTWDATTSSGGWIRVPSTDSSASYFHSGAPLPIGVVVSGGEMRGYKTSGDTLSAQLREAASDGSTVSIATLTQSGTGYATTSGTFSSTIRTGYRHYVNVTIQNSTGGSGDARFLWLSFDYDTPDYTKTL